VPGQGRRRPAIHLYRDINDQASAGQAVVSRERCANLEWRSLLRPVIFTRRQRRRILLALLPLLTIVWAMLPALPCCHELGGTAGNVEMAAMAEHAGHHAGLHGGLHDGPRVDGAFAVDHGANHCEQGPAVGPDPPCKTIEKTSNDIRPVQFAAALVVLTSVLPVLQVEPTASPPLPDPSPPPRYRSLHLEKSVLLI
jgi:hypothetical protein